METGIEKFSEQIVKWMFGNGIALLLSFMIGNGVVLLFELPNVMIAVYMFLYLIFWSMKAYVDGYKFSLANSELKFRFAAVKIQLLVISLFALISVSL